jgi:hypothetical protein
MKKIIFFLLVAALASTSCKKAVEKKQEDLIIKAMTDGQWIVTNFAQNGTDLTTDFSGYKFQYFSNRTVDAIKNGTVEKTGTWDGDVTTMSTWANFTNASNPILRLNGTWHIDKNSWTFVVLSQIVGADSKTMRLEKQ